MTHQAPLDNNPQPKFESTIDRPIRVILLSPVPPPYGGISHWTQMVRRYAAGRADLRFDVVNTAPRWRAIHEMAIWKRAVGGGIQLLRDLSKCVWFLATRRSDAAHLTTSGQLSIVRDLGVIFVATLFGTPVAYHIRFGRIPAIAKADTREWRWMRRAIAMAHTVIPIDVATEETIRHHLPRARVRRIPNCVDIAQLSGRTQSRRSVHTVLYLGWVIPTKGLGELTEAWSHLGPRGWRLAIAGTGDETYRREILERCPQGTVECVGELTHDEAMRALADADIFVLPSHTEGFPNVVLEAMALGKPIVATTVGAVPEMLSDGCGVLVEPRDVDALAAALVSLMENEAERARLGERARRRVVARYSLDAVFAQYMATWREMGERKAGARGRHGSNGSHPGTLGK